MSRRNRELRMLMVRKRRGRTPIEAKDSIIWVKVGDKHNHHYEPMLASFVTKEIAKLKDKNDGNDKSARGV